MSKPEKVVLEFESREDFKAAYLDDLPSGGVFVQTEDDYSVGELVALHIVLPEVSEEITLHGRVAWRRAPTKWSSALKPGIGVSLDEADPKRLDFIQAFIFGNSVNRRERSQRIPVAFKVQFEVDGTWYSGQATNISKEGIFISTQTQVAADRVLILKLHLDEDEPPVQCHGRVARQVVDAHASGLAVMLEYKSPIRRRKIYSFIEREKERLQKKK